MCSKLGCSAIHGNGWKSYCDSHPEGGGPATVCHSEIHEAMVENVNTVTAELIMETLKKRFPKEFGHVDTSRMRRFLTDDCKGDFRVVGQDIIKKGVFAVAVSQNSQGDYVLEIVEISSVQGFGDEKFTMTKYNAETEEDKNNEGKTNKEGEQLKDTSSYAVKGQKQFDKNDRWDGSSRRRKSGHPFVRQERDYCFDDDGKKTIQPGDTFLLGGGGKWCGEKVWVIQTGNGNLAITSGGSSQRTVVADRSDRTWLLRSNILAHEACIARGSSWKFDTGGEQKIFRGLTGGNNKGKSLRAHWKGSMAVPIDSMTHLGLWYIEDVESRVADGTRYNIGGRGSDETAVQALFRWMADGHAENRSGDDRLISAVFGDWAATGAGDNHSDAKNTNK